MPPSELKEKEGLEIWLTNCKIYIITINSKSISSNFLYLYSITAIGKKWHVIAYTQKEVMFLLLFRKVLNCRVDI